MVLDRLNLSRTTILGPTFDEDYRGFHGPSFAMRCLEIEITTKCNLYCNNCDRICKLAKSDELMTVDQIKHFLDESFINDYMWDKFTILGGEPTLHPDLMEIVDLLDQYRLRNPDCQYELLSNKYTQETRDIVAKLPDWIKTDHIGTRAAKTSNVQPDFYPMTSAPIDMGIGIWLGCECSG